MKKIIIIPSLIGGTLIMGGAFATTNLTSCSKNGDSGKMDLPNFEITPPIWPSLTYGYENTSVALTNNFVPPADYTGAISYSIINNVPNNRLSISDSTLTLATGLNANVGGYDYKIRATASSDSKYRNKSVDLPGSIVINKASANDLTVNVGAWTLPSVTYGYTTAPTATLSLMGNPTSAETGTVTYSCSDTVHFIITGNNTLSLKTGLGAYTYSTTVSANIDGGTNYQSGVVNSSSSISIEVTQANASALQVEIGAWNPTSVTYGYASAPVATLSLNAYTDGMVTYTATDATHFEIYDTNKLRLKTGQSYGSYSTTVSAIIDGATNYSDGYVTPSAISTVNVSKAAPTTLTVQIGTWTPTNVTCGYTSSPVANLSLSTTIDGTVTYTATDTARFEIYDNNKLRLKTGQSYGSYSTTVSATISGATNYNNGAVTTSASSENVTVDRANFPDFTMLVANQTYLEPVSEGYQQQTLPLTNTCTVTTGTTFVYSKISGDARFSISGNNLVIGTGLRQGTYPLQLKCTATNSNYYDKDSATLSLNLYVYSTFNLVMRADSDNGYTASASAEQNGESVHGAYKVFDTSDANDDYWCDDQNTSGGDVWLGLDCGRNPGVTLIKYSISAINVRGAVYSNNDTAPTAWTLQAVNDGEQWVTLDTRSGVTWSPTTFLQTQEFTIANDKINQYKAYKMWIHSNNGNPTYTAIQNWIWYIA